MDFEQLVQEAYSEATASEILAAVAGDGIWYVGGPEEAWTLLQAEGPESFLRIVAEAAAEAAAIGF